jgi:hypothetical protein
MRHFWRVWALLCWALLWWLVGVLIWLFIRRYI